MDIPKKILVIGAGPAGLSALKALNQLTPRANYQITCIDKQPDWSGQWNYTWRATTDKYGEHVHSSMYSQLWTNLPKEVFEFPDFTFKEYFGKPVPSYLPR
jgi:trimethylamine monooxygenase